MFDKKRRISKEAQELLTEVYDFILEDSLRDKERQIGLLAKNDLEKGRYTIAVLTQLRASLQREALNMPLSPQALFFYKRLAPRINKMAPLGTNRGNMMVGRSYLD